MKMEVLKKLRQSRNLTQQELSVKIGIQQQTLNKYEIGTSEPKLSSLIKMADYFHTTIDYLAEHSIPENVDKQYLVCEDTMSVCNYSEAHLLHLYRQMPNEIKRNVIGILYSFYKEQKKNEVPE